MDKIERFLNTVLNCKRLLICIRDYHKQKDPEVKKRCKDSVYMELYSLTGCKDEIAKQLTKDLLGD